MIWGQLYGAFVIWIDNTLVIPIEKNLVHYNRTKHIQD